MDLPSIVTDINGCNEIIIEGQNGPIIPVQNVKALQAAMQKMVLDVVLIENYGQGARHIIVS
jgi:glycosyltransferase involved in cell wall biosynthesis